jgi:hypothetical protein
MLWRADVGDGQAIDSTTAKAHRSAADGKGGRKRRQLAACVRRTTRIQTIVDARGRPIAIEVTPAISTTFLSPQR